jgi:hypothetical protein
MIENLALVELRETIFQLQEDFESFRKSMAERLDYLERHLPAAATAEYRALVMKQQIEDYRHGR